MSRVSAFIHIAFIVILLVYSIYNLFMGRFEKSVLIFPILAVYYIFIIAPHKRAESNPEDKEK